MKRYSLAYVNTMGHIAGSDTTTAAGIIKEVQLHRCLSTWPSRPGHASVMVWDTDHDKIHLIPLSH